MSTEPCDLAGLKAYPRARAGHEYHPRWPRNIAAVDAIRRDPADHLTQFQLTTDDPCPSWVAVKGQALRINLHRLTRSGSVPQQVGG